MVSIKGLRYYEHRLLYCFYHKGSFQGLEVDHKDQNKLNNRIDNLDLVTPQQNQKNQTLSTANTSGYTGVGWRQSIKRFRASITVNKKSVHLGYFENIEEAIKARKSAEVEYGFHSNHGQPKQKV